MRAALLDTLQRLRRDKRAFVVVTDLGDGTQRLFDPAGDHGGLAAAVAEQAMRALEHDRSERTEDGGKSLFLQVWNPPLRLFLIGAVHITQALAEMAGRAGFAVSIVDPRTAFASETRFPGVAISTEWPDRALGAAALDRRSAVVTLTHDPKLDDPALAIALGSPAFYIGSLGSRKTHAARMGRLRKAGFGEGDIARLHGPVGLAIGARSHAEIAVSILAQIIQTLRVPKP